MCSSWRPKGGGGNYVVWVCVCFWYIYHMFLLFLIYHMFLLFCLLPLLCRCFTLLLRCSCLFRRIGSWGASRGCAQFSRLGCRAASSSISCCQSRHRAFDVNPIYTLAVHHIHIKIRVPQWILKYSWRHPNTLYSSLPWQFNNLLLAALWPGRGDRPVSSVSPPSVVSASSSFMLPAPACFLDRVEVPGSSTNFFEICLAIESQ